MDKTLRTTRGKASKGLRRTPGFGGALRLGSRRRSPAGILRLQRSLRAHRNHAARIGGRAPKSSAGGANRATPRRCCSPSAKWPPPPTASPSSSTTSSSSTSFCTARTWSAGWWWNDAFYRAQVEHDLRAKLLRLRQKAGGMLADAGPAAPPAAGFGFHFLRALPPRPDPARNPGAAPETRRAAAGRGALRLRPGAV